MKSHNQREIATSLPPPYLVSRQSKKRKWLGAVASLISFLVVVVDVIVNAVKGREMRSYYFVDLTWKETAQLHFSSPSQQAHRRALSLTLQFLFVIKPCTQEKKKKKNYAMYKKKQMPANTGAIKGAKIHDWIQTELRTWSIALLSFLNTNQQQWRR